MKWALAILVLGVFSISASAALSSRIVGITLYPACPHETILAEIRAIGKELRAEQTVFFSVIGQELCPATLRGRVAPIVRRLHHPHAITYKLGFGVTVGIHMRPARN